MLTMAVKQPVSADTSNGLVPEGDKISGSLDPAFVEYLMGYRTEWTNLDASAMQWFRNKPKSRSKS